MKEFNNYWSFTRVTSDCNPWHKGGKLGVCASCGSVQKIVDREFHNDCKRIYDLYSAYHQSQGQEQRVFNQSNGESRFRSEKLLNSVFKQYGLPSEGLLLDVGCGNGNLLRSFSKLYPSWKLTGLELNDRNKQVVNQIKNVEAFYTCDIEELPIQFDIITMLHTLEHIIDPVNYLKKIRAKLKHSGFLLIQTPDYTMNPFDLLIADHCSHFDLNNLKRFLHLVGFNINIESNSIISKETSILAKKKDNFTNTLIFDQKTDSFQNVVKTLYWLKQTIINSSKIAKQGMFGIFGTSIAGTWLCNELGNTVSFFVDEDPSRTGKEFMGRPVYNPQDVPSDWNVFIALPFSVAYDIWNRIKDYDANFFLPPVSFDKIEKLS